MRSLMVGLAVAATLAAETIQADEALNAVKALRSVVEAGPSLPEYSSRLVDAKILIDRYRSSAPASPIKDEINAAMKDYEIALKAWNSKVGYSSAGIAVAQEAGKAILEDPGVKSCPQLQSWLADFDKIQARVEARTHKSNTDRAYAIGSWVPAQTLWSCAADRITKAEKLTTTR